jgi:hypothetical protein
MNINGRVKVKTLKAQFFEEFGLTIRVYDGRSFADDNATLASIRRGESIGGEFSPRKNTKVGNLEDKIKELFGLKTQIAGSDNSYLCDNKITLAKAKEDDDARMERKARKASRLNDSAKLSNSEQNEVIELVSSADSVIIKEFNFNGESINKVFNKILIWDEADALENIDSFESSSDIYAMIFNSAPPMFSGSDNLEELYDNENELWENIEEYLEEYNVDKHELWELITKKYCSMLAKFYTEIEVGEFSIENRDITGSEKILIKLLKEKSLSYEDLPEEIGLTNSESLVECSKPSRYYAEVYNFDENAQEVSLSSNTNIFPSRPPYIEKLVSDYDINHICLLFSQSNNGHIESIYNSLMEQGLEYVDELNESDIEIEIEDLCNYFLKKENKKIDFTRLVQQYNNDFYEWVLSCSAPQKEQNSVTISQLNKLVIQKNNNLYYFSADSSVVDNAERKSIDEIINLLS